MDDSMSHSEPKELNQAKQFMDEYKFKEALELVNNFEGKGELNPQDQLSCHLLKSILLGEIGHFEEAIKFAKQAYQESQELGDHFQSVEALSSQARSLHLLGNLDESLYLIEQGEELLKTLSKKPPTSLIRRKAAFLVNKANIYYFKGEWNRSIEYYQQGLALVKHINNKFFIASCLNNIGETFQQKGDIDQALQFLEESLLLLNEIGNNVYISGSLYSLISAALVKPDLEKAQHYLKRLEQISNQEDNKLVNLYFRLSKALMLKISPRVLNLVKAEEILRQIIDEDIIHFECTIVALLNLCDLLLSELRMTNDMVVLTEIAPLITRLLKIAEDNHSYWILGEVFLLKAKLELLSFDMKKSRQYLTQAQNLAEKYDLNNLAKRISIEHDNLLKQLSIWENLKKSNASLTERMEFARLNDQIIHMLQKRAVEHPKLEAEQPVLFAIMTKEGDVVLSSPFTADMTIDDTHFGEFLSSCDAFCDQIFSESFDRVKFGRYTILITALDSFCIYYMFQGHSYSAQQKLNHFCEAVKKDPPNMKVLENAVNVNKVIKVNDYPSLEDLITESFLSDPQKFQMPFKAYEGDDPFVFVSYSHTDRLQVYPIIDYLNKTGINIWYDEGIPVSEDWKKSIVENLERCRTFLVFITPHIIDSDYVRKEISFALKKKKKLFAVYLKETELPNELEFEIADIQLMKKYLMPETKFYTKLREMLHPVLYE